MIKDQTSQIYNKNESQCFFFCIYIVFVHRLYIKNYLKSMFCQDYEEKILRNLLQKQRF